MELSARKKQILKAIIGDYIRTAEPVGSKALTEGHELPFSSATIRNEMSELEEMGYLEKPHTSAGRIPSPQGYRLYVDELMEKPGEAADDDGAPLQQTVLAKVRELDHLIQEAGKLLTSLTNYASVAITPTLTQVSIRRFEIIAVDKMNFVIVVVTDSGTVKNKMVRTVSEVSKDEAELLDKAEDVDETYVQQVLPGKMAYNLASIRHFGLGQELLTMLRTVKAVL